MLFSRMPNRDSQLEGLRDRRQIDLYVEREEARKRRAERREVEARVRQMNFDLVQRAVLLVLAIAVSVAVVIAAASNPELLKLAVGAGGLGGVIAAMVFRRGERGS